MTAICVLLGVFLAVTPHMALAAILMTAHAGVAAIWGAILGAAIVSTRSLKLGLTIGTIALMMHSFNELSEAEKPSPDSLAGGISLSLVTTAIGLALGVKELGPDSVGVLVPALIIEGTPGVIATS